MLPNRFSKTLLQFDVVEGVHMSGKLQVHRYLTLAITRWKLCAATKFEISHFQPVHCLSKNPISPKSINQFSKTLLQLEVVEGGHMGAKIQVHRYFTFAMARWQLCASKTFEISHFQHVHCPSKNPISPKVFNRFSETFLLLEDVEGGHMGGKLQLHRYFTFAMTRWKLCASTIFEISHFQHPPCPSKNPISPKTVNRFRKHCFGSKLLKVGIWVGSSRCTGILLLQWQGENFAHRKHLKFPTFNMYTVPAKILYLQRYSIKFRKLSFSSKMLKAGIWVDILRFAGISLLPWQGENFAHRQHSKFPTFNRYTVPAKTPYLQRYSTDFRKLFFCSKMLKVRIWVESCSCTGILPLEWQGENFSHQQYLKFHTFNIHPVPAKTLYLQRKWTDFENIASARSCWSWAYGWEVAGAQVFYFCNAKVKTLRIDTFEISHFQPVHCPSKNPISPKVFNQISKTFLQ